MRRGASRREFLGAAGLGAAALLAGCAKPAREIEGRIVDGGAAVGHRLRDGRPPAPNRSSDARIVIVGGGIAGLSAAWRLRKDGVEDFELLELLPEVGGNATWGVSAASEFPWGAHYLPVPTSGAGATRELLAELGVLTGFDAAGRPQYDERFLCFEPEERLFLHGRWQEGLAPRIGNRPEDDAEFVRFRARMTEYRSAVGSDGRPAFAIPLEHSSRDPELLALDRLTFREWIAREGFRSKRLVWFADYAARDDYGGSIDTVSAWAGIHYYSSREVEDAPVLTWPEGNGWLVKRLRDPLGDRIRRNSLVVRIAATKDGAEVDRLDVVTGEVERIRARHVVCALPRFVAARVVEGLDPSATSGFVYGPWVVANLEVDRPPIEAAWDNVLYDSPALGYVVATHQNLRVAPAPSVLTWYRAFGGPDPAADRRALEARDWRSFRDEILADLAGPHPELAGQVRRLDVRILGHAMVRPTPGTISGETRRLAARPLGGIHFAHSDLSGLSLFEEAQWHGVRAAEEILAAEGKRGESRL